MRGGFTTEPTYEELKAKLAEIGEGSGESVQGRWISAWERRVGVSVYGLGRFPVTLYYEQWVRLLDVSKELREFLEENKSAGKLKLKES